MATVEGLTRGARLYALKELTRRAGVTREFFRSWKIEFHEGEILVDVLPPARKLICFKSAQFPLGKHIPLSAMRTARTAWMRPPTEPARTLVPDFIVPFVGRNETNGRPLFMPAGADTVECSVDLLASILLTLTRYEEVMSPVRDAYGRFTAVASVALRDAFLQRPIIDEYGLAFEQVLQYLVPGWQPVARRIRVKLSHDIDDVGGFCYLNRGLRGTPLRPSVRLMWMMLPFNGRYAIQQVTRHRDVPRALGHVWGRLTGCVPSCLDLVRQLVALSKERDLDSAVYWKAGPLGPYDSGYDLRWPKFQPLLGELRRQGVELGVHPGYETFGVPERLASEVQILREALGEHKVGGRQHYLRWCPDTWVHWEQCDLAYDSTLTFADHYGFRAGTCFPYRPWLLAENREARLLEIPLAIMDGTLIDMQLSEEQSFEAVEDCFKRAKLVGGVFTFLCHNYTLLRHGYLEFYKRVLNLLAGAGRFDWKTPAPEMW
jgi:hypothetical protein